MVVLRRAMLGLVHSATPYFHPIGGRPPRSAAHLRQAHYLISRTACSKPTKRSSKRPATLGVASCWRRRARRLRYPLLRRAESTLMRGVSSPSSTGITAADSLAAP